MTFLMASSMSIMMSSSPCAMVFTSILLILLVLESSGSFSVSKVSSFMYGSHFETDLFSYLLLMLLLYVTMMMIAITNKKTATSFKIQLMLLFTLILVFTMKNLIAFYVMFEVSLIPVGIMILGEGYQPERFLATSYMFIYTISSSMPLLVLLLNWLSYKIMLLTNLPWLAMVSISPKSLLFLAMMASFMVKLPVYGVHLWLPKAHVEAPLEGSIILAGLMLKLGGFGIIYLMPLSQSTLNYSNIYITAFSGVGGVIISVLCLRMTDVKMLIAYSSVSHMALVCMTLFCASKTLMLGSVFMMLSHGVSSPGMFAGAYVLYSTSNSRNLLLNGGNMTFLPYFSIWWFTLCAANMAAPPSINLISEVYCIISLWWVNESFFLVLGLLVFNSGAYTLVAYSFSQHGSMTLGQTKLLPLNTYWSSCLFVMTCPLYVTFLYLEMFIMT